MQSRSGPDNQIWANIIDFNNPSVSVKDIETGHFPKYFNLFQNYPNPFNPETSISFALPQEGHVLIEVYNVLGQKVATLVDEYQLSSYHRARWDGRDAAGKKATTGIYLCRMKAGDLLKTQKMTLLP